MLDVVAVGLTFANTWMAEALDALIAAIWLVSNRRIEREVGRSGVRLNGR